MYKILHRSINLHIKSICYVNVNVTSQFRYLVFALISVNQFLIGDADPFNYNR